MITFKHLVIFLFFAVVWPFAWILCAIEYMAIDAAVYPYDGYRDAVAYDYRVIHDRIKVSWRVIVSLNGRLGAL